MYAIWKNVTEYTITYNANGGEGTPETQIKIHDVDVVLSIKTPTREGYIFCGWSTNDIETTYFPGDNYNSNESIALYAVWEVCTHNWNEEVIDAPTCTEKGNTKYTCSLCNATHTEADIDELGHVEVIDKAVESTCEETGLTEGKHCSRCNEVLVTQTVVKALGHNKVTDEAVAPDCTNTGLTEGKHCSRCNEVLVTQNVVEALGHVEVIDEAVPPTCESTGLTEGKHCSRCGQILVTQDVVDKLESYIVTYDANGGEGEPAPQIKIQGTSLILSDIVPNREGYIFQCWETDELKKSLSVLDLESTHGYENNIDMTWTVSCSGAKSISLTFDSRTEFERNYDYLYLYNCNGDQVGKFTGTALAGETIIIEGDTVKLQLKTDNIFNRWGFAVTNAVAQMEAGVYAPGDSYVMDADITLYAVWGTCVHNWNSEIISEPNCTAKGKTKYTCSVCNDAYTEEVDALGHIEVTDEAVAPDCTNTGLTEGSHCSRCNEVFVAQTEVEAIGHNEVIDEAVPPTYETTGLTEGSHCGRCGEILVAQEVVDMLERATYVVTYDANGGTGSPLEQTKKYNISLTLRRDKPTRTGYTFQGWSTSKEGSVEYAAGGTYSVNESVVLYAVWKANQYKIIYNANGGTDAPKSEVKTYGVDMILSSEVPKREGYVFIGWSTSKGGEVVYRQGDTYSGNAYLVLYAVWLTDGSTKTKVTNDTTQVICDITLAGIDLNSVLIVAGYRDSMLIDKEVIIVSSTTERSTISNDIDTIKVFVLDSEKYLKPITESEIISMQK